MLQKIGTIVKLLCLVMLSAIGALTLNEMRLGAREVRTDIANTQGEVGQLLATVDQAASQARDAAGQANLAAQEQRAYWNKTSLETYKTMASLRLAIVRTNESVNDKLTPELAGALHDTAQLMTGTAADLHQTAAGMQPVLQDLARASSAAADTMADPHIRDTLDQVDGTSKEMLLAFSNVADTTQHLDTMAALLEKRLRQMLKPASLAVRIAEQLIGLGATTYGVVK